MGKNIESNKLKLSVIEKKLKYKFKNIQLLIEALTHCSVNKVNNEKLEFLGDSILNFIITEKLYNMFPEKTEGELTRIRSNLIKKEKLIKISKKLNLQDYIIYGNSIKKIDIKTSILANTIEAVFASIYLDGGIKEVKKILYRIYKKEINCNKLLKKDPKTLLQELLQNKKMNIPIYEITKTTKNNNKELFHVKCTIKELNIYSIGKAYSKKIAEQKSAKKIIKNITKINKNLLFKK